MENIDYGLCIRNCSECEYLRSFGCGLNYDGEPYLTDKELLAFLFLLTLPFIIIGLLILYDFIFKWGV